MKAPLLTDEDWNFSPARVPNNELVACLLWEFLRESQTAQKLVQDWRAWRGHTARGEKDNQAELWARMKTFRLNPNHKLNIPDFIFNAVFKISAWHELANVPWQTLPSGAKKALLEPCERVNDPVYIALAEQVGEMAHQVDKRWQDEVNNTTDGGTLSPVFARALLHLFKRDTCVEAICIVVDWGRYNDKAIKDGFTQLAEDILNTRPKDQSPQYHKARGKKNEEAALRPKLKNLGLTRLSCGWGGISALRRQNPQAYEFIKSLLTGDDKSQADVEKLVSKARKTFEKNFRLILPFENARPLCLSRSRFGKKSK